MQSAPGKAKILQGVGDRLKPGGQYLSHEMLAQGPQLDDIYRELANTIRGNTAPLSESGWQAAYESTGLNVEQCQTGPMALLNPWRKDIALEPGVWVVMPANAPHALRAIANLAFLLTLSQLST
ncbi:hypothetical protein [Nodosilinea sp. LEGE 07088]|uniref:hypothetical protein n=1 Tax=Nodosilinea sp. LEGE 07088 TaxID=2777968 RepID=UPI001D138C63|nr:hypothetical protein [Nodosilinea sp. LEGE 07088]